MLLMLVRKQGYEIENRWYDIISGGKTQAMKNQEVAEECVETLRKNFYKKGG